jgi:uncharacterized membrane protein (UPF0127 family)
MIEVPPMTRPGILLLTAVLAAGCGGSAPPVEELPTGSVIIDSGETQVELEVSIAETAEARQRGLMGVEEMGENSGMVFLEEEPVQGSFWMKDTLLPLSIAFWDEAGEILAILDMEPCREEVCPFYDPGVVWIGALEVNQGFFEENGVETGDTVTLER